MPKVFLERGISRQELEKGIEFEVDHEECGSSDEESFDDDYFNDFKQEIADIEGDRKLSFKSGACTPFAELKTKMEPITEDGQIMKEVIKHGFGIVIPEKSVVVIHYDAYLENAKLPFDSTHLRNRPYKFLLGDGAVIPGLELAIQTMKNNEMSRFIVSCAYAYGAMGCPPRIPVGSDILYEVEVINFFQSKDAIEFEEMSSEDQKKAPFEKIVAVFQCEHQMGNELFRKKMYKPAIARYRKVVKLLEDVSVDNEENDDKRKKYLLKLYLNLAQCYINLQNPQKAVIYSDLALKIDSENPKGLYRMGYALYMTEDYERAESFLNRAKKQKPYEKSINMAIQKLEKNRKQHEEWERMFCQNIFTTTNKNSAKPKELLETEEFRRVVEEEMKQFLDSDEKEYRFSPGYTESQIEVVKELANQYNLAFVTLIQNNDKIIKVAKRKVPP